MNDLADFLLARIAEDEAVARAAAPGSWETRPYWFTDGMRSWASIPGVITEEIDAEDGAHIARWDPARVLAECEARRRIVERYRPPSWGEVEDSVVSGGRSELVRVLRLLALPYADHPGYRPEWRP